MTHWPPGRSPAECPVHAVNRLRIPASPERVWAWLLRAELWPTWYPSAADIHFLSHTGPDLRDRSRFRWKVLGVRLTSKVLEFEPRRRLAWETQGIGLHAWQSWLLTPQPDGGTEVLSEETQAGWLARLGKAIRPDALSTGQQRWLQLLSRQAQSGSPPAA